MIRALTATVLSLVLTVSASALDGAEFSKLIAQCAACHGADGIARDVEIPDLAGQHDVYLFNQLLHFKSGRRPHKEMRYMSRHLNEEEMRTIADYYAKMKR
jgi:cytochrome c553